MIARRRRFLIFPQLSELLRKSETAHFRKQIELSCGRQLRLNLPPRFARHPLLTKEGFGCCAFRCCCGALRPAALSVCFADSSPRGGAKGLGEIWGMTQGKELCVVQQTEPASGFVVKSKSKPCRHTYPHRRLLPRLQEKLGRTLRQSFAGLRRYRTARFH